MAQDFWLSEENFAHNTPQLKGNIAFLIIKEREKSNLFNVKVGWMQAVEGQLSIVTHPA